MCRSYDNATWPEFQIWCQIQYFFQFAQGGWRRSKISVTVPRCRKLLLW